MLDAFHFKYILVSVENIRDTRGPGNFERLQISHSTKSLTTTTMMLQIEQRVAACHAGVT